MQEGMCKHYSGVMGDTCDKGIRYDSFTNGMSFGIVNKIPCLKRNHIDGCASLEFPTPNELGEHEKWVEKRLTGMRNAIVAITEKHKVEAEWESPTGKNKPAKGTIECPICDGILHYSISGFNGHIWGRCETKDCLAWMQ